MAKNRSVNRTARVVEDARAEREAMNADLLSQIKQEGGRLALIAAEMPNGSFFVYGPENVDIAEASLNVVCAYFARVLGADRALDIATGATVGRATDHQ